MKLRLLAALLVLMLGGGTLLGWLVTSDSGLRWAYDQAAPMLPGEIKLRQLSGSLNHEVVLEGVSFVDASTRVEAERIALQWNLWALLWLSIDITSLEIEQLEVELTEAAASADEASSDSGPPRLQLPLDVQLQRLRIDEASLTHGGRLFNLQQLILNSAIEDNQLSIDALDLRIVNFAIDANHVQDFEVSLAGKLDTRGDYAHQFAIDWQTRLNTGTLLENQLRVEGNLAATRLTQQTSGAIEAELSLQVQNLLDDLNWQARLDVARFDTHQLEPTLPGLVGAFEVTATGNSRQARLDGTIDADSSDLGKLNAAFKLRSLDQPRLTDGLQIESLELDLYEGKLVTEGRVYWAPELSWTGQVTAQAINPASLLAEWPGRLNAVIHSEGQVIDGELAVAARIAEASGQLREYPFALQGTLNWRENVLQIESLQVDAFEGQVVTRGQVNLAPRLSWNGRLETTDINPAAVFPEWPGKLNAVVYSEGQLDNDQLQTSARISETNGTLRGYPFALQSKLQWRNNNLEVESARLTSGNTQINTSGRVGEQLDLLWSLASRNLAELYPGAQGQLNARGHLGGEPAAPIISADFNGQSLIIDDYRAAKLDGKINVDLLNWQELDIRLAATDLDLQGQQLQSLIVNGTQKNMQASIEGSELKAQLEFVGALLDNGWQGQLTKARIDTSEFDNWRLKAPAGVSLGSTAITLEKTCLLSSAEAEACARIAGLDEIWSADIDLLQIPLRLLRQWTPADLQLEGVINASADLEYSAEGKLFGKLDASLPAAMASYPLQEGKLDRFDYRQAEMSLSLDARQASLSTSLVLENGDHLQGSLIMPEADILQFNPRQQAIEGRLSVNAKNWAVVDALLPQIENLKATMELDVSASGSLQQPLLQGDLKLRDGSLLLRDANLTVDQIRIDVRSDGSQRARFQAEAMIAEGRVTVQGDTLLDRDSGWASNVALDAESLDIASLLAQWIQPPLRIDGKAKGSANLQYRAPDLLFGEVQLSSAGGTLSYPLLENEKEEWEYRDLQASIMLDKQGITARSALDIGNQNSINLDISLPQARLLNLDEELQTVQGSADLRFKELDLIQYLIPEVDEMQGQLELTAGLAGTLAQPSLMVDARMQEASFEIPRLGLRINRIALEGSSDEQNRFNFKLSAHSGDGRLIVKGSSELDSASGWPSNISIQGEDFEVSRIPEAQVTITPDLKIEIAARSILIEGDLLVPYAKLQPKDISTAARVSNDSVIIGKEAPAEERWQVTTRVNLILGERVTFFGFGFEGRLGGRLLIEDVPGKPSLGTGEITVYEGRYRAYGQRLDVENGRLLFTGSELDNPGLDVRAVRKINDITVGLLLRGRPRQPELELFSTPTMGQTDMLSYLLFGRPMETASGTEGEMMAEAALALGLAGGDSLARSLGDQFGLDVMRVESSDDGDQASLVVGRYLSPRLYVSYGVGLIESINSLNLRYELSERWRLEAESGEYQGADVLYSIER